MLKNKFPWSDWSDDPELGQTESAPCKNNPLYWRRIWQWSWKIVAGLVITSTLMTLSLRWIAPRTSAFMSLYGPKQTTLRYQWVPWSKMSSHLPIAIVAAEDQKFPNHWGFDLEAIGDALEENKQRSRPRGASTISQQVAKNLFLWSGRSYLRKGLEAYFTIQIELLWPKKRILEVYLNIAQFGPDIYGVGAASQAYFHKPPAELLQWEAALLAAVLPNPHRLSAKYPSEYVQQRAAEIQHQIDGLGGPGYLSDL
jgi:monofunctional glycosyltransferase